MAKTAKPTTPGTTRTAKPKTERKRASAAASGSPAANGSNGLEAYTIADRAFELFCARGGGHGHDLDDWLQAESELRSSGAV